MNKQTLSIGLLVVVALVAGVILPRPLPTQITKEIVEKLGAFPGPDMISDYFGFNGVKNFYVRQAMNTGTATPCVIEAPSYSTTTLVRATADIQTSTTSGTTVFSIGKNVNRTYSTTTSLADVTLASPSAGGGAAETIVVNGTSTGGSFYTTVGASPFLFKSGDRLVFGYAGGNPTTGYPTGNCTAIFEGIR